MSETVLNILQTVTKQRDVDSLEISLVMTLLNHFDCARIALYDVHADYLDITLELLVHQEDDYSLSTVRRSINDNLLHEQLLSSKNPIYLPTGGDVQQIFAPLIIDHTVIGALEIDSKEDLTSRTKELDIFIDLYRNYLAVLRDSERDKLTQLYNRKTFDQKLVRLIDELQQSYELAQAEDSPPNDRVYDSEETIWLAVLDIDHFKAVNDKFGHVCGDEVLLTLANLMRQSFRRHDLLFRYGGEEFVVVLAPTSQSVIQKILERFRKAVSETHFPLVGHLTVSIGYQQLTREEFPMQVVEKADNALYFVKANGRNSVKHYQQLVDEGLIQSVATADATDVDLF